MCHVSCVTCPVSSVTCHVSRVTCNMSPVSCKKKITVCSLRCISFLLQGNLRLKSRLTGLCTSLAPVYSIEKINSGFSFSQKASHRSKSCYIKWHYMYIIHLNGFWTFSMMKGGEYQGQHFEPSIKIQIGKTRYLSYLKKKNN